MADKFKFPQTITYDGLPWRLLYAPDDPTTVPPNLEGSQVQSFTCDPVTVPGRPTPLFIAILDIVYPPQRDTSGRFIPERRLKAFRTYGQQPYSPNDVRPNECAFYIAETSAERGSAAQRFFNALIGYSAEAAGQPQAKDDSWCKDLMALQEHKNEQRPVSADGEERPVSDQ